MNFLFQNLPQGKNNWLLVESRHVFDDFFSENTTCKKENCEIYHNFIIIVDKPIYFSDQYSSRIPLRSSFGDLDVVRILYE